MILDLIFGGIILLFALRGLAAGLVRQTMAVARIVVSIIGASMLAPAMIPSVSRMVENQQWRWVVAFAIVFFALWILTLFIEGMLLSLIKAIKMTALDRIMGFTLGAVCGIVLCVVLTIILLGQPFVDLSTSFSRSYIGQILAYYAQQLQSGSLKTLV